MKYILSLFILSLVVLSACAPGINTTTPLPSSKDTSSLNGNSAQTSELTSFASEEEYLAFANSASSRNYYGGGMMFRGGIAEMAMADSAPSPALIKTSIDLGAIDSDVSAGGYDGSFSETNNQVQGVDEADLIKTDGNYIYTITEQTLFIVEAGNKANVVSRINLEGYANGLFVQGNKLALFGYEYDESIYDAIGFQPQSGMTFFHVYDITNKEKPILEKEYSFEGGYFDARMIDGQVYFIVQSMPEYRTNYPLPIMYDGALVKSMPLDRMMWYPGTYDYPQLVTIHSINLEDEAEVDSLSIAIDNLQTLYMSHNTIYLLGNEYISEYEIEQDVTKELVAPFLSGDDKQLITLIESTDARVLTQGEKDQKILQIYYQKMNSLSSSEQKQLAKDIDSELVSRLKKIEYFTYTTLQKIKVDDGKISFSASGKVPGRTVNQFSLDEFNDNLRIATTVDARWSRLGQQSESYTNVFVLDATLETIGKLTELAPTEQIYSTRFMGERLYMVTFRQVDPFFVIDLSVPTKPSVLGDLKIPGFSRYLHPYDENHIIGIGQDATELGRTTGLKISLYNVEDVTHPKEVASYVSDEQYASSTALYEHKAFLFNREKNLLVIPAYNYGWNGDDTYNGAFVFNITPEDIELRGLIDHSSGDQYSPGVERSLFIDDLLYTKSPYLIRVNSLDTLEGVVDVTLKPKSGIPTY